MSGRPTRIVKDSMLGLEMPDTETWSARVTVVLGQNPGLFSGPGTNTYIVGTGPRRFLLDTGQGTREYLPILESALHRDGETRSLEAILLTHDHPDHSGGVEDVRSRFGNPEVLKKPTPERPSTETYRPIEDGTRIETEGATLDVLWTPGHASDHVCFYCREEKALFTGDLVLGAGTVVIPPDGDLRAYLDSLRRILELDVAVIYPGHGPAIRNPHEKVREYLEHRELRELQILDALRSGIRRVPDLVVVIYRDIPSFLHPAAAWSVEAHLRKLRDDGIVRPEGDEWAPR